MDVRTMLELAAVIRPRANGINVRTELRPAHAHSQIRPLWSERHYQIGLTPLHGRDVDLSALTALREAVATEISSWLVYP